MTRVFVSGAAGVIGTSLVPKLLAAGHDVLAGDLKPMPKDFSSSVIYLQGDLNELETKTIANFEPEAFIHLAATFERSAESPGFWTDNFVNNVSLSHHLSTLALNSGSIRRLVNASSYLVYDPSLYMTATRSEPAYGLSELANVHPRNLIGSAKYFHELELEFMERAIESPMVITNARIFRGYGRGSRDVISRWVRSLLAEETIEVYGQEGVFDYVFADDSAEGLLRIMENHELPTTLNLGGGIGRSVRDICSILVKHFPAASIHYGEDIQMLERSVADISLLEQNLGWRPEHSLEQGIEEIIKFEKTVLTGRENA